MERYRPETEGVLVAYNSIYGHTAEAANKLAETLRAKGVETVSMDLARCDMAEAVAQAFRFSKLVLATPTYNADVFPFMKDFINHLTERNYQNRTVASSRTVLGHRWPPRSCARCSRTARP